MKRIFKHRFYRPTLLSIGCLAFLLGIGLSNIISVTALLPVMIIGLVSFVCLPRANIICLLILMTFGLMLGVFRGGNYLQSLQQYNQYYDQKVKLSAKALADAVYGKNGQLSFDVSDVSINGQKLIGKLGISGFGEGMVYKGDWLSVTGKIRTGKGSYRGWISYGVISLQKHDGTIIDNWRRQFGAALTSVLPEPLAPFGMGLLIGQRNTLPDAATQSLLHVGLVHIIAVSGYNLTIIIKAVRLLLKKGSKYQLTVASVGLIGVFLLFAGNSPSIVRAAIISLLSLMAWYYGRNLQPLLMILLTAAITAFANPSYVWSDSGWYLSFLAFSGVIILAPLVIKRLPQKIGRSVLGSMVIETLCAEVMTIPYVLYIFGQVSLVSLVANILIATFVPLAMLLTMVAGLAGLILPTIAGWLAWPATGILNYMLDSCALFNKLPHIFIENTYLKFNGLLVWYASLAFVVAVMVGNRSRKVV